MNQHDGATPSDAVALMMWTQNRTIHQKQILVYHIWRYAFSCSPEWWQDKHAKNNPTSAQIIVLTVSDFKLDEFHVNFSPSV